MAYSKDLGNGKYRLFAEVGKDRKGRRRRKTKIVTPSGQRELKRMLSDFEYEVRNTEEQSIENITFGAFKDRWRKNFADKKLAATTNEVLDYVLKPIITAFEDMYMREIRTLDIEDFFTAEADAGRGSLEKKYYALQSIFGHALRWEVIESNPMDGVGKPHTKKKKLKPYTMEEVKRIADHFPEISKYHQRLIMIAFEFSLRRGEVVAIAEDVLDYERGGIWIKRALVYTSKHGLQLKCTKTGDETFLHCTEELMEELRAQRNAALRNKLLAGPDWNGFKDEDGNEVLLLFADPFGVPYHPNAVTRFWGRFVKRTGIRQIRFHDLRHSSASIMAREQVNMRAIQSRLRHRKLTTTNRYLHTDDADDIVAAETFKGVWGKNNAK
ncbi:site-specific integrase [Indiicoccus explosivorum]|uniref:site-specific integrase n=1 Tax=Indiicoccus explosivorum TaxID=1917864 RepID=UPI000B44237B|nr:site-specific integrase [Indiicoccus explosivorum]